MDYYHVWCNLRPGTSDLEFAKALGAMMDHFVQRGWVQAYTLTRRKLGFGPQEIGEFHCDIQVLDMAQLERAFDSVAPRTGEVEALHAAVWSKVVDLRSALYRDFPDPERGKTP